MHKNMFSLMCSVLLFVSSCGVSASCLKKIEALDFRVLELEAVNRSEMQKLVLDNDTRLNGYEEKMRELNAEGFEEVSGRIETLYDIASYMLSVVALFGLLGGAYAFHDVRRTKKEFSDVVEDFRKKIDELSKVVEDEAEKMRTDNEWFMRINRILSIVNGKGYDPDIFTDLSQLSEMIIEPTPEILHLIDVLSPYEDVMEPQVLVKFRRIKVIARRDV